ncbi:hypothetical protein SQV88_004435 [Salmonella enterica]|nr:hypothetical protein [Salmonella enterica]
MDQINTGQRTQQPENMCTIRRRMWEREQEERNQMLLSWALDNAITRIKGNSVNKIPDVGI